MRGREFIAGLGGVVAWPLLARAQRALSVVGYLDAGAPDGAVSQLAGLRKGLRQMGYVEGRNAAIEYRSAINQPARIPALAAELVVLPANVLVAAALNPALQAKAATTTIPIVFQTGSDPVGTLGAILHQAYKCGINHVQSRHERRRIAFYALT